MIAPAPNPDEQPDDLNRHLLVVVLIPNPSARPILPSWIRPGPITLLTADDISRWVYEQGRRVLAAPWN